MTAKIEKGIPVLPAGSSRVGQPGNSKYPFADMEVGDSFFVPDITATHISATAVGWGQRHGRKFTCRTVDGGCRVWRIG